MRQKLSLAAEPHQQRILVLAMEINPFEEMLTISGAAWFNRRGGTADYTRYK